MTAIRPTLKELQWQVREDAILQAAHDLIGEQGYAEMSMDDLATRIGISKATLYQHFASKEEVGVNVIVRMMQRGSDLLLAVDPNQPAVLGLEHWLRTSLELRIGKHVQGMNSMPRNVTEHPLYCKQEQVNREQIGALIERAKREGDVDPAHDTAIAARLLMRLFRGDYDDFVTSGQYTPAQVSGSLVGLVVNGLRTRSLE